MVIIFHQKLTEDLNDGSFVDVVLHHGDLVHITMGALGTFCPKIPRNVIFARISLFLVPMALTCIKEHMKTVKGR